MKKKYKIALIDFQRDLQVCSDALKMLDAEFIDNATLIEIENIPDIDLCLTIGESEARRVLAVRAACRKKIPTLMLMDGIVEWRNTWEHYTESKNKLTMPLFQPVLSNKIACYGYQQARFFQVLGNSGKAEIVGSPRLDYLFRDKNQLKEKHSGSEFKILVATAKTLAFSEKQRQLVLKSLSDVNEWAQEEPIFQGLTIKLEWRISDDLYEQIGVKRTKDVSSIQEILKRVDAVITTPSTLILEAMILDKPVAIIDYTNSPQYLVPSWTISQKEHLDWWVPELISPPPAKLFHQQMVLNDTLYIDVKKSASERLAQLITDMAAIGRRAREDNSLLIFPKRMLDSYVENSYQSFSLLELYPDIEAFKQNNIVNLQVELGHLREENKVFSSYSLLWKRRRRYGYGSLVSRLVHCFPYPRRMILAVKYWREDKNLE